MFATYASRHGHTFIDRLHYLPKAWTNDPARMAAAHVPPGRAFATKPALARQMIEQAIAAEVAFSWVAADTVYEVGEIETALRRAGKGYVLGVASHCWAIEDSFEAAKNELGLDHNETRSWHGWHRHFALVMLAFAMTAAIRHHAYTPTPPKTKAWIARMLRQT